MGKVYIVFKLTYGETPGGMEVDELELDKVFSSSEKAVEYIKSKFTDDPGEIQESMEVYHHTDGLYFDIYYGYESYDVE